MLEHTRTLAKCELNMLKKAVVQARAVNVHVLFEDSKYCHWHLTFSVLVF